MTADLSTFIVLGALVITTILLVGALGQALGERGRAGISRIIAFFAKDKTKEVSDDIAA